MPFFPALSNAQRRLSQTLVNFKFECIGNNQTDDELVIANSLKEFGKLIAAIEDEKDRLLDRAFDQFIVPLENFRKEHIGAVKERKKKFEKQTAKFCASQERYLGLSTKKQDTVLQEVRKKTAQKFCRRWDFLVQFSNTVNVASVYSSPLQ